MGSTPHGIPYPEPIDLVANGAAAMQAIAEAVDPGLDLGAWQTWTPTWDNVQTPGEVRAVYQKTGRTVKFRVYASNTGQTGAGAGNPIRFSLPHAAVSRGGLQWSYMLRFYTGGSDQYNTGWGRIHPGVSLSKCELMLNGSGQVFSTASFFNGSNFDVGGEYEAAAD